MVQQMARGEKVRMLSTSYSLLGLGVSAIAITRVGLLPVGGLYPNLQQTHEGGEEKHGKGTYFFHP